MIVVLSSAPSSRPFPLAQGAGKVREYYGYGPVRGCQRWLEGVSAARSESWAFPGHCRERPAK